MDRGSDLIVCEHWFDAPDKANPNYSHSVVDFYAWIPFSADIPNHSLHLRKNLRTGLFEVYRVYILGDIVARREIIVIKHHSTGRKEMAFTGSLEDALKFAAAECARFHENSGAADTACQHTLMNHADFCPALKIQDSRSVRTKTAITDSLYAVK